MGWDGMGCGGMGWDGEDLLRGGGLWEGSSWDHLWMGSMRGVDHHRGWGGNFCVDAACGGEGREVRSEEGVWLTGWSCARRGGMGVGVRQGGVRRVWSDGLTWDMMVGCGAGCGGVWALEERGWEGERKSQGLVELELG